MARWFEVKNINETEGEIRVYGEICKWAWEEFGETSAVTFTRELSKLENVKKINLRVNSPGGDVYEALAIYNELKRFSSENEIEVVAYIDGLAASAASFLILAAKKIIMGMGTLLMIHNPSVFVGRIGSDEMRKTADYLDKVRDNILDIYMTKCKLTREEVSNYLNEEKWFDANEAVEAGFADEVITYSQEVIENNIKELATSNCIEFFKNKEVFKSTQNIKDIQEVKMTLKELKEKYKGVLDEYKTEILAETQNSGYMKQATEAAVEAERKRIKALENIPVFNDKQKETIMKAKYEEPRDANEIIVEFYNSQATQAKTEIEKEEGEKAEAGLNNLSSDGITLEAKDEEAVLKAALEAYIK